MARKASIFIPVDLKDNSTATDLLRWTENLERVPSWVDRNRLIAASIPRRSTILDIGAGSMSLRTLLEEPLEYVPVDVVKGCPETVFADFNRQIVPVFSREFDYAVCSGLVEYIVDPTIVFNSVRQWTRNAIISYASVEQVPSVRRRVEYGWLNHFSINELSSILVAAGLVIKKTVTWHAPWGENQEIIWAERGFDLRQR